jgi:hypothetical protein
MTTVIQKLVFPFPSVTGKRQVQIRRLEFGRPIKPDTAFAMLAGFEIQYNNGDHHILQEQIQVEVNGINGTSVDVAATFLLRDGSGNIDDPYSGFISALVIADVA